MPPHTSNSSTSSDRTSGTSTAVDLEAQSTTEKPSVEINERTSKAIGDRTAFILSHDNINKTTLVCHTLGVQYDLKTTGKWYHCRGSTQITRTDPRNEKSVLVAEWERNLVNDKIRLLQSVSGEFLPVVDVLRRVWKFPFIFRIKLIFQANGKPYLWDSRLWSLKLYPEDGSSSEPIASYSKARGWRNKQSAFIALSAGYDKSMLDDIVVTWALTLRRRQKNEMVVHLIRFLLIDFLLTFLIDFYTNKK